MASLENQLLNYGRNGGSTDKNSLNARLSSAASKSGLSARMASQRDQQKAIKQAIQPQQQKQQPTGQMPSAPYKPQQPTSQPNFWQRLAGNIVKLSRPTDEGGINILADAGKFGEKALHTGAVVGGGAMAAGSGLNKVPAVQKALLNQLDQSLVDRRVASGKATPAEFGKKFTQTGLEASQYVLPAEGAATSAGLYLGKKVGTVGLNALGKAGVRAGTNAVLGGAQAALDQSNHGQPLKLGDIAKAAGVGAAFGLLPVGKGGKAAATAAAKSAAETVAPKTVTLDKLKSGDMPMPGKAKGTDMAQPVGSSNVVHHSLDDTSKELNAMDIDQAIQDELKAPGADIPTIQQRLEERTGMSRMDAEARVKQVAEMSGLDIRDGAPTRLNRESSAPLESLAGGPNTAGASMDELRSATDQLNAQTVKGLKGRENAVLVKDSKNQRMYMYQDGEGNSHTFTMYRNPDDTWSKPWNNPSPIKNSEDISNSMRLLDDAQMNKEVERATQDGNTRQYIWTDADNGATKTLIQGKKDAMTPKAMQFDPEKHYISGGFVRNKDDDQILGNYVAVGPNGIEVQVGRHFVTYDMDFSKLNDGPGGLKRIGRSEGGNNSFNQTERWIEAVTKDAHTRDQLRNLLVHPTRDAEAAMKVEGRAMGEGINKWEKAFKDVPRNQGTLKDMMRDAVYVIEPDQNKVRKMGARAAKKEALDAFRHTYGDEAADTLKGYSGWLREAYDNMLGRMNAVRRQFGMEEIEKRPDYLTHSQEVGSGFSNMYQSMKDSIFGEIEGQGRRDALPANIAGLSDEFSPVTKFNQFAKHREGDMKPLNPFDPLRKYSAVTLHNIHMTAPAARTRSLQQALRSSSDYMNDLPKDLKPDDAASLTAKLGGEHSDMVNWLKEHANVLSGKTPEWDRLALNSRGGRAALKTIKWAQRQAGMANILGNLNSAVSQTLNLPTALGTTGAKAMTKGIIRSLSDAKANAAWRQSSGMIERYTDASNLAGNKGLDKVFKAMGVPLGMVERATYHITWNAAYENALAKGLKGSEARRAADTMTTKINPSRSIGDTAHVYNNSIANAPLQFTREQTEAWKNFTKDMSPYGRALTLAAIFAMNAGMKATTGRAPLPDPVGATVDTVKDFAGQSDNEDQSIGAKVGRALQRGAETVGNTVPLVSAAANTLPDTTRQLIFGKDSDLGRYDGSMALTNVAKNITSAVSDLLSGDIKKAGQDAVAMVPGGSQIRKTLQGIDAMNQGYTTNGKGNVDSTTDKGDAAQWLQALVFGKNALPGKQQANDTGKSLSDADTKTFLQLNKQDSKKAADFFRNAIMKKSDPTHTATAQSSALSTILRNLDSQKLGLTPSTVSKTTFKSRELTGDETYQLNQAADKRTVDAWNALVKRSGFKSLSAQQQNKALNAARSDAWAVEKYLYGQKLGVNDKSAWKRLSRAQRNILTSGSYQDYIEKVSTK